MKWQNGLWRDQGGHQGHTPTCTHAHGSVMMMMVRWWEGEAGRSPSEKHTLHAVQGGNVCSPTGPPTPHSTGSLHLGAQEVGDPVAPSQGWKPWGAGDRQCPLSRGSKMSVEVTPEKPPAQGGLSEYQLTRSPVVKMKSQQSELCLRTQPG